MKSLKIGIAGHGLVGKRRHRYIDEHPAMTVVAVSDQKYADGAGGPSGLRSYGDFRELIAAERLDALFVCLPNAEAAEATILGLEHGMHVFCEKPPGRTVADIRQVREVEMRHPGRKLKYGFNHRYHDSVLEALSLIQGGSLGTVINIRGVYGKSVLTPKIEGVEDLEDPAYWRRKREIAGGGILLDQGIHMVDLMRCFGGEFTDVKSFVENSFWQRDVEDNAYAIMRSEGGTVAMLHSSATQWRHMFSLVIGLTGGSLTLAGILTSTKSYGQATLTITYADELANGNPRETRTSYIHDNSWEREISDFATHILNDTPVDIGNSEDALKTMDLVYRIYCADDAWRTRFGISL